jgi:hypothetical protein
MNTVVFRALEGSNPLAFLAALGALRLSDLIWPQCRIQLRWVRDGGWRPELVGVPVTEELEFCLAVHEQGAWVPLEDFAELGDNLTVSRSDFEKVVRSVAMRSHMDRRSSDFAAAFGCEIFEDKGRIEYTDLCFVTGSGHQDFLGTARKLAACVDEKHLREALFGPWRYADRGLSMRWDPDDAKEYALRWQNPSDEGVASVWGANRLALEALPLFPTVPTLTGLRTTGFRTQQQAHEFTWPIWRQGASVDTVRSLVALRELEEEIPDRAQLEAMGVADVFRAERVRIGQGANFKVSFRPARSV